MSAAALVQKIAALPATEQKKVEVFVDELMAQSTSAQLEDPFFAELDAFRTEIKAEYGTFPGALRHLRELRDSRS